MNKTILWSALVLVIVLIFATALSTAGEASPRVPFFCFHYGWLYMRPGETLSVPLFVRDAISDNMRLADLSLVGDGVDQLDLTSLSEQDKPGPDGGASFQLGVKCNAPLGSRISIQGIGVRDKVSPIGEISIEVVTWEEGLDSFYYGAIIRQSSNFNLATIGSSRPIPPDYSEAQLVLGDGGVIEGELVDSNTPYVVQLQLRMAEEYWNQQWAVISRPLIQLYYPANGKYVYAPGPLVAMIRE